MEAGRSQADAALGAGGLTYFNPWILEAPLTRRMTTKGVAHMNPLDGEIRDGRHHQQVRIYYEDTDFSGIVYHANYLRFMERGRTNYLRLIGADHRALFEQAAAEAPGFAFVVRHMTLDFKKPAHMDDLLDVITTPEEVKGASVMLYQQVKRGEDLLVDAHVQVAFVSGGRARPIPKPLRIAMKADQEAGGDPGAAA
jgi:acyl-CoA thioester hydrolase